MRQGRAGQNSAEQGKTGQGWAWQSTWWTVPILWHCILEKSKGNQPRCLLYSCHLLARWFPYPDKEGSGRIDCARLTGLECWVGMQTLHLEAPLCMLHRLLSQKQRLLQAVTARSPLVAGWQERDEERKGELEGEEAAT